MSEHLTAVYIKTEKWFVAYLEEIPGVNTQGATLQEAKENLIDAFQEFMLANRSLAARQQLNTKDVTIETFANLISAA